MFEQYTFPDPSYLGEAVLVGDDNSGHQLMQTDKLIMHITTTLMQTMELQLCTNIFTLNHRN